MSLPLRILQVGMSPTYGGTEAFVMAQYRQIDRYKIQFDFLNVYHEKIACQDEIELMGGRIYYLNMARHEGITKYRKNIDAFFQKNHKCFDGIHCNYQSLINIDILRYAKKYKIPMRIAHAHNSGYGRKPNILQKALIFYNKLFIQKYATHFCACSALAAQWMFPHSVSAKIIQNAIDANAFRFSPHLRQTKREELELTNDNLVLVFVGRLDPQKNPIFLLEVFYEICMLEPKAVLLVVGSGILQKEMEEFILSHNLQRNVRMLGTRKDVNGIMNASDGFILPSRFEGFGTVLIEAQTAGLPCFATADVIPKDVDVTGTVRFISLNSEAKEWATCIVNNCSIDDNHPDYFELIKDAGYDSKSNAKALLDFYCDYLAR